MNDNEKSGLALFLLGLAGAVGATWLLKKSGRNENQSREYEKTDYEEGDEKESEDDNDWYYDTVYNDTDLDELG